MTTPSSLTEEERDHILHCFGLDYRVRWSYRNYWYGEDPVCDGLVAKGFMIRRILPSKLFSRPFYYVTDAGIAAAGLAWKVRLADRTSGMMLDDV